MAHKPILIVDDDPDISSCLQEVFEGEGYPVLLAADGQEALRLLQIGTFLKPGLIFLDFMMPVMDGPTFLLELERTQPELFAQIPIFGTSAGGDKLRFNSKTTGFLKKPFDLDELIKIASGYCQ